MGTERRRAGYDRNVETWLRGKGFFNVGGNAKHINRERSSARKSKELSRDKG